MLACICSLRNKPSPQVGQPEERVCASCAGYRKRSPTSCPVSLYPPLTSCTAGYSQGYPHFTFQFSRVSVRRMVQGGDGEGVVCGYNYHGKSTLP